MESPTVFFWNFCKINKKVKIKTPIIYIFSKLIKKANEKLKINKKIELINPRKINNYKLNNNSINLLTLIINKKNLLKKYQINLNNIKKSFDATFKIIKKEKIRKFINGQFQKIF